MALNDNYPWLGLPLYKIITFMGYMVFRRDYGPKNVEHVFKPRPPSRESLGLSEASEALLAGSCWEVWGMNGALGVARHSRALTGTSL